jgi:hypothetical protein
MDLSGVEFNSLFQLAALAVMLVLGWTLLRFVFKLTATLFRIGCAVIALIMLVAFVATAF